MIPLPPHAPESSATAQRVSAVSSWHTNLKMTKMQAAMEDIVKMVDAMGYISDMAQTKQATSMI